MCLVETGYPRADSANNRYSVQPSSILVQYTYIFATRATPTVTNFVLGCHPTYRYSPTSSRSLPHHSRRERRRATIKTDRFTTLYFISFHRKQILRHPTSYREGRDDDKINGDTRSSKCPPSFIVDRRERERERDGRLIAIFEINCLVTVVSRKAHKTVAASVVDGPRI